MGDLLTINELAKKLSVSPRTVFKYLSIKNPEGAVISKKDWYRLPGGDIRIKKSVAKKLLGGK
jgi:Mn-dependent DtxR family transcriptional regulator